MTAQQTNSLDINTKISKTRSEQNSIIDKLAKLEQQKQSLITQRKEQIFDLISQTFSLSIDDELLAGALLFLLNPTNLSTPIIQEFQTLAKKHKIKLPSRKN